MGFAFAAVVLLLTSIVPFQTARMARETGQEVELSLERTELLNQVWAQMQTAEAGQRGFLLSAGEDYLERYHTALVVLRELRPRLAEQARNGFFDADTIARLDELVAGRLEQLSYLVALRRSAGLVPAARAMAAGSGKQQMDTIRDAVHELERVERERSARLLTERDRRARINAYAGLMVTGLDLILLAYLFYLFARLARARRRANDELRATEESLKESLAALRERSEAVSRIGQLGRALDAPSSMQELYRIVSAQGNRLLPATSWGLYAYRNSRDLVELKAVGGDPEQWIESFEPGECWALRRGQPHESPPEGGLVCAHFRSDQEPDAERRQQCFPLIAHGEVLGLLAVRSARTSASEEAAREGAIAAVAEQLSLSISNMRLREALRLQSILDPLTGLFNRRYLDETLRRELARAGRARKPLAVVMLDLDHFKRINDEHGHDAGDAVLRTVAQQLKASVRASDVACRYGGEEFALVLPDCTKADAVARCQGILDTLRATPVRTAMQTLKPVTASLGVAVFPEDAPDGESLIGAADRALYRAKGAGRDRIVAADGSGRADRPADGDAAAGIGRNHRGEVPCP